MSTSIIPDRTAGRPLALVQVLVLARDRLASALRHELGMLPLAGMHPVDRLARSEIVGGVIVEENSVVLMGMALLAER